MDVALSQAEWPGSARMGVDPHAPVCGALKYGENLMAHSITNGRRSDMTRLHTAVALVAALVFSPMNARADVVLDWDSIAMTTLGAQGQSPFAQARYMSITQLA